MDHAVEKTPEREAFYRRIDGENLSALWNVMGDLITREPRSGCRPHLWRFDAIRGYMMEAGQLITAKEAERRVLILGKSRPAWPVEGDHLALCRRAAGDAGRGRAGAPAQPVGAALHPGGQGRPYHRGRRADQHGAGRFRHYACDGLARPRQRDLGADVLARRPRHSGGAVLRRLLHRGPRRGRPAGDAADRRQLRALRPQPAAGGLQARGEVLAGVQLSLRPFARGAGDGETGERVGPLPRAEAALRQSGHRRFRDADHRHLPAAAARGASIPRAIVPPTPPCSPRSRAAVARGSASRCSNGARATSSWCRAGTGSPTRPTTRPCCSVSPTARCSRSSICFARIGGMRDRPTTQVAMRRVRFTTISASPAGLTRGSTLLFAAPERGRVDCRVKPGNDENLSSESEELKNDRLRIRAAGAGFGGDRGRERAVSGAPHRLRRPQLRRARPRDGQGSRSRAAVLLHQAGGRGGRFRRDDSLSAARPGTSTTRSNSSSPSAARASPFRASARSTTSSATASAST